MKAGDSISYLNEKKTGTIVSINKQMATILDEYGFKETVDLAEIVLRDEDLYAKISVSKKQEDNKVKSKKNAKATRTLDLHFQNLVKNPNSYSAQARLQIQKENLIETLEYCKKNPIKKLTVIHGIGDGILQEMVFDVLKGYSGIEYEDQNIFHQSSGNVEITFR